jgi:hypothetical protein
MSTQSETLASLAIKEYNQPYCYGLEYIIEEILDETSHQSQSQQPDWLGLHDLNMQ